jgi:hypothetical protein
MSDFFRFPHTPHLAWLGKGWPRDNKVLAPFEAVELLASAVVVGEEVDGANIGFSVDDDGVLRVQNRGKYLARGHSHAQFAPLFRWIEPWRHSIAAARFPVLMLFDEWCYAVHSVTYSRVPDWFLAFDVYDRERGVFWGGSRRDALVEEAAQPRKVEPARTQAGDEREPELRGKSRLTDGPAEGFYVRRDEGDHLAARAKLVRAEFVQAIDKHWSRKALRTNALAARSQQEAPWR